MEEEYQIYLIYRCPRCTHMRWDAGDFIGGSRMLGYCAKKKKDVKELPEFGLASTPSDCDEWARGKPQNLAKKTK